MYGNKKKIEIKEERYNFLMELSNLTKNSNKFFPQFYDLQMFFKNLFFKNLCFFLNCSCLKKYLECSILAQC